MNRVSVGAPSNRHDNSCRRQGPPTTVHPLIARPAIVASVCVGGHDISSPNHCCKTHLCKKLSRFPIVSTKCSLNVVKSIDLTTAASHVYCICSSPVCPSRVCDRQSLVHTQGLRPWLLSLCSLHLAGLSSIQQGILQSI